MDSIQLLLSDAREIYIPRDFVDGFDLDKWGLDPDSWEVQTCLKGPSYENDDYWEAWQEILNHAEYKTEEGTYSLYQDGDLWAICPELMTDEEKHNFGFED